MRIERRKNEKKKKKKSEGKERENEERNKKDAFRLRRPLSLERERKEREREGTKKGGGVGGKNPPKLLEHGEQLRLHVLLPHVEHARIDEPLFQGERGLPGLGGRDGGRGERARDEEAREDVVVLPPAEPDADL